MKTTLIIVAGLFCIVHAQQQKLPDPVPILKQISKQNDDGSYSFGYENGDGSFKIETKYPDGSVQGKYGYVDDSGNLREVEYGASKNRGFEPSGSGINVPPPTLSNDVKVGPLADGEEDDGQYREDPSIYDTKAYKSSLPAQKAAAARRPVQHSFKYQEPAQQTYQAYQEPEQNTYSGFQQQPAKSSFSGFQQQPAKSSFSGFQQPLSGFQQTFPRFQQPVYQNYEQPQQTFSNFIQPQQTYSTYQQPQQQYTQQPQQYFSSYNGHPNVKNFDIGSGSYSINYSGR